MDVQDPSVYDVAVLALELKEKLNIAEEKIISLEKELSVIKILTASKKNKKFTKRESSKEGSGGTSKKGGIGISKKGTTSKPKSEGGKQRGPPPGARTPPRSRPPPLKTESNIEPKIEIKIDVKSAGGGSGGSGSGSGEPKQTTTTPAAAATAATITRTAAAAAATARTTAAARGSNYERQHHRQKSGAINERDDFSIFVLDHKNNEIRINGDGRIRIR